MKATLTSIAGVLVIEPQVFCDSRGFFFESFNQRDFNATTGTDLSFVQDNHSHSGKGVLHGLHYQVQQAQGKLVRVAHGAILDVAVDIRADSPTFGQHVALELSAKDQRMLWIPEGFMHGFMVLSESADVLYKTTDYYAPQYERCVAWNDPEIGIKWPVGMTPRLSAKDQAGSTLREAEIFTRPPLKQ